ncbi:MAG TPA: hypothetical protein VIQ30_25980 [Pseudonocardia sp.]|jgi:hypothetical protein
MTLLRRVAPVVSAVLAAGSLLVGCAHPAPLTLTGPKTDVVVTIPDGWHQVINTANPVIPEMVSPTTCSGAAEVSCALGLARTATFAARSPEYAADIVRQSVIADRRITDTADVSKGPGKIGVLDGYRYRFTFRNPQAILTCEVAAGLSGPDVPDVNGDRQYSVILVWMSDKPGAPEVDMIDKIMDSVQLVAAQPRPAPPKK